MYEPIRRLFEAYAEAFDKLDFKKQAEFFADDFMMTGPKGVTSQSKQEFLASAEKAVAFYKNAGQTSVKMIAIDVTPLNNEYVIAKTHWGVTFEKTGDKMVEFDMSYIVHETLPEPKIILAIAHQDEDEAMKGLQQ